MSTDSLLARVLDQVEAYRAGLAERPVGARATTEALRTALGGPLPREGTSAADVLDRLAAGADGGLVATDGPRYFGFVIGGSTDAALGADLLATGWDQNAFNPVTSPASAVVEEVAAGWLKELLGLPAHASVGFVPGGQGANTAALTVARNAVLAGCGHDVNRLGLRGAPPVRVLAGEERHTTIDRAVRLVGLGTDAIEAVAAGPNGVIDVDDLARRVATNGDGATIVCLQAGNVNTGGIDDLASACAAVRAATRPERTWIHVDGAFGLWAAASPRHRHLVAGAAEADSWTVDGHKWLNVPQDCGYVICARPPDHAAALSFTAAYLQGQGTTDVANPADFTMESSRRSRGFATWAAIAELGAGGIADLVDRCCRAASRFAAGLGALAGAEVVNDVMLNQVLVRVGDPAFTDALVAELQREGTCWMGATTWRGERLLRVSVSNWTTTDDDVDRSVAAVARCIDAVGRPGS